MLDGWARRQIDPALTAIAHRLARAGISADTVTIAGFAIGLCAAFAIVWGHFLLAAVLILASRLADGLDGAVAGIVGRTDRGGYLDIVLDFAFYAAIPAAFVIADPAANAVAGAILIASFYVNGGSFLAYAAIAEKRAMKGSARGVKSFFFTTGLAEATETLLFFVAFCLFPGWFAPLAWLFAALCFYTALSRIVLAYRAFN